MPKHFNRGIDQFETNNAEHSCFSSVCFSLFYLPQGSCNLALHIFIELLLFPLALSG